MFCTGFQIYILLSLSTFKIQIAKAFELETNIYVIQNKTTKTTREQQAGLMLFSFLSKQLFLWRSFPHLNVVEPKINYVKSSSNELFKYVH